MTFFWLFFLHLLADYPLQGQFLSDQKGKNVLLMISHSIIWTGFIYVGLIFTGIDFTRGDIIVLFIVHFIADTLKAKNLLFYKNLNPLGAGLWIDQGIHALQLIYVLYF